MIFIAVMKIITGIGGALSTWLFRKGGIYNPHESTPVEASKLPQEPLKAPEPVPEPLRWDTPQNAFHSVRVICDEMGLSYATKNTICACIYQESQFKNGAIGRNKDKQGNVLSTDWGIVQVNDWWHIGPKKTFPSVEYVLNNPEKMVRWMIQCQQQGQLRLWSSYSTGAYKKWLSTDSRMWVLKTA